MKATKKGVKRARPTVAEVKMLRRDLEHRNSEVIKLAGVLAEAKERLAAVERLASTDIAELGKTLRVAEGRLIEQKTEIDTLRLENSERRSKLREATDVISNRNQLLLNQNSTINQGAATINQLTADLAAEREKVGAMQRQSWASRFLKRWR